MKRYEFDMISEGLDVPALLLVFHDVACHGGRIVEYELEGPGGGAERFVVEVKETMSASFEALLEQRGHDVEACIVK